MIHYSIEPHQPHTHRFRVQLKCLAKAQQVFSLPNWIPGSYLVRDFAKHIHQLRATDENQQDIAILQRSKETFQLSNTQEMQVRLSYEVYAWDLSVRTAHLDQTHGFFNGSSVFLAVEGQTTLPCQVEIILPQQEPYRSWNVATGMPQRSGSRFQAGLFEAQNYDALIDYPVEMGALDIEAFDVLGTPHYLVLSGRHFADTKRIAKDLQKICTTEIELFGGTAPFESYLFLTTVVDQGYGGLEHRNSTALLCSREQLIAAHEQEMSDGYISFLGLCSHEYFHNWNVKRIKPQEFLPYQLQKETYTRQLWAYEGITSYYDDWLLYRSGIIDQTKYLQLLAEQITRVLRGSGRHQQSLIDSSYNAWTKFYQQGENAANAIVSYYTKGALFALYLDLNMRLRSQHQVNIDGLMQHLWQQFGDEHQGTTDETHQKIAETLCQQDLNDIFQKLHETDDIPLSQTLAAFGVSLKPRGRSGFGDKGGLETQVQWPDLGLEGHAAADGFHVKVVRHDSAAAQAGLSAGDVLIAFDALKVNQKFEQLLRHYRAGTQVECFWFRRDQLMKADMTIAMPTEVSYYFDIEDPDKLALWLNH